MLLGPVGQRCLFHISGTTVGYLYGALTPNAIHAFCHSDPLSWCPEERSKGITLPMFCIICCPLEVSSPRALPQVHHHSMVSVNGSFLPCYPCLTYTAIICILTMLALLLPVVIMWFPMFSTRASPNILFPLQFSCSIWATHSIPFTSE